jgi:hypothetical protein
MLKTAMLLVVGLALTGTAKAQGIENGHCYLEVDGVEKITGKCLIYRPTKPDGSKGAVGISGNGWRAVAAYRPDGKLNFRWDPSGDPPPPPDAEAQMTVEEDKNGCFISEYVRMCAFTGADSEKALTALQAELNKEATTEGEEWHAIACSDDGRAIGYSEGQKTKAEAAAKAISLCDPNKTGACELQARWKFGCGYVAMPPQGSEHGTTACWLGKYQEVAKKCMAEVGVPCDIKGGGPSESCDEKTGEAAPIKGSKKGGWFAIACGVWRNSDGAHVHAGVALNRDSKAEAEADVLAECREQAQNCVVRSTGQGGCGWVTVGTKRDAAGKGVAACATGPTKERALANCTAEGYNCDEPKGGCGSDNATDAAPPANGDR